MKTYKTIIAVLFAAAAMATFSCTREEENSNNQNQQQEQPQPVHPTGIDLSGTTWEGSVSSVYTVYGIDLDLNLDISFDFNDTLNAEMFMYLTINYPEEMEMDPEVRDFTETGVYYFDGQKLYMHDVDDYSPYTEDTEAMTFNPSDTTFIMPVDDSDMEEMIGASEIILHLTHGTFELK